MREQFILWMCWGFGAAVAQILIMLVVSSTHQAIRESRQRRQAMLRQLQPDDDEEDRDTPPPWHDPARDTTPLYPHPLVPDGLTRLSAIQRMLAQRAMMNQLPCTDDARVCSTMVSCEDNPNASTSQNE